MAYHHRWSPTIVVVDPPCSVRREASIASSIRGLGAGNGEGGRTVGLKRARALCCLEVLLFCSGNNAVFSPKRGNLYGKEGVHVELNRHRGIPLYFFAKKGHSKKSCYV